MRYIEVPGHIDEHDRLILDESLDVIKPQQVKIDIWFRDDDEEKYHEPTKEEILEGFREGFRDCLEGRTSPIAEMWDELMIKTTGGPHGKPNGRRDGTNRSNGVTICTSGVGSL